ncbi:MAG: hypothetical protein GX202_07390, partial [Firmicutes bacterium]|nr:hypothetical protein [Bacillota bacterium]
MKTAGAEEEQDLPGTDPVLKCYNGSQEVLALTYEQALAYIHSRNRFGIKLGLERMRALLAILGAPQQEYPVIHIAGTNGKGSTTALVGAVLKRAGYRVGVFTSPHLSSYCERLVING